MLILSETEIADLLDPRELIDALAPAMAELSAGTVSMPTRIAALVAERDALMGVMPVYASAGGMLCCKLVTVFPRNEATGPPSHQAVILVFDATNGSPTAMLGGTYITALRTACGSALATRLLARDDASVLTIVGTGVQARTHARAIPLVRKIREIRIVGRDEAKARDLAREIATEQGIATRVVRTIDEAVRRSDVVCATTHAAEPVILGEMLEPGMHVTSVGFNASGREVDESAVVRSRVYVEYRPAALTTQPGGANDLVWPIRDGLIDEAHIRGEIGELVAGTCEGRTCDDDITLYKSVGVAIQDAVAARLVLDRRNRDQRNHER